MTPEPQRAVRPKAHFPGSPLTVERAREWIAGLCKEGVAAARAFPPGDEPCAGAAGLAEAAEAEVVNVSVPLVDGCTAAAVGSIRCANVCERALCASVPAAGDWPVDVDAGSAVVRQVRGVCISEPGMQRTAESVRGAPRGRLRAKTESAACGLAGRYARESSSWGRRR